MSYAKLKRLVWRHRHSQWQRPPAHHTAIVYEDIKKSLNHALAGSAQLVLDSCSGVGASTVRLARDNPSALVLGVDKSTYRLAKHHAYAMTGVSNYRLVRADCADLWMLLQKGGYIFDHHFLLYPNPWPKSTQRQRRWYAMPVMRSLVQLQKRLTVRSNCLWYLEEFAWALRWWGLDPVISPLMTLGQSLTPFEAKYQQAGQQLWNLSCAFE